VVVDTNVMVSAIRSRRGASFRLVSEIGRGSFELVISVPLIVQYEAALREHRPPGVSEDDVEALLNYVCGAAREQEIFYLWRPLLRDPKDDMVLEVAVAGRCRAIVTYNRRDFSGADRFGLRIVEPFAFLQDLGIVR
jgi:predicted nucleic acid-binding protein